VPDGGLPQPNALTIAVISDSLDLIPQLSRLPPPAPLGLPPFPSLPVPPKPPISLGPPTFTEAVVPIRNVAELIPGVGFVVGLIDFILPREVFTRAEHLARESVMQGAESTTRVGVDAASDVSRSAVEDSRGVVKGATRSVAHSLSPSGIVRDVIDAVTEYSIEKDLGGSPESELLTPIEQNLPIFPSHVARVLLTGFKPQNGADLK
jgi:hypothetical protein